MGALTVAIKRLSGYSWIGSSGTGPPSINYLVSVSHGNEGGRKWKKIIFFHSCSWKILMFNAASDRKWALVDWIGVYSNVTKNVKQGGEGYCLRRKYYCSEIRRMISCLPLPFWATSQDVKCRAWEARHALSLSCIQVFTQKKNCHDLDVKQGWNIC